MVIYRYDANSKSIKVSLNQLPEEAWTIIRGDSEESPDVMEYYNAVPFAFRCVDARAQAISSFPRDIMRGGTVLNEEEEPLFSDLDTLLYQIETALCIYGRAYLQKQEGLVDFLGVRWLAPKSITPKFSEKAGLEYFERRLKSASEPQRLEIDEVVYFWQPAIDVETGPGTAPLSVAASACSVLQATTQFSYIFFNRGAVFPMLLTVSGNPIREEMDKLESWWKRLFSGVKDAFKSAAVRAEVKPEIIGPKPDEMAMPELTEMQREDIATALGVPHSLVLSNAANFATAGQDALNFYDQTVVPQFNRIAEVLNEQLLVDLGMTLVPRPERLELYQQRQLTVATGIRDLVVAGILKRDEAREIAGFEPLNEDDNEPMLVPNAFIAMQDGKSVNGNNGDLAKWQRKALNRLKAGKPAACEFESEHIPWSEMIRIQTGLSLCRTPAEVRAVFRAGGELFPIAAGEVKHAAPILAYFNCPNCEHTEADSYSDHGSGALYVCRGCGNTYDPQFLPGGSQWQMN